MNRSRTTASLASRSDGSPVTSASAARYASSISRKRPKNLSFGGRRLMARKSMSWMNSRVRPPLARRTVSTSRVSPGMYRSCPMRSSGPDGTSRMPVASTTMTPG